MSHVIILTLIICNHTINEDNYKGVKVISEIPIHKVNESRIDISKTKKHN